MSVMPCQSSACKRSADQANDVLSYMATLGAGFRGASAAELGGDVWVPPEWSRGGSEVPGGEGPPVSKPTGCQKQGPGCASASCNECADMAVEVLDYMATLGDGIARATPEGVLESRRSGGCFNIAFAGRGIGGLEMQDSFRVSDEIQLPVPPEDPPEDEPCGDGHVTCGVSGRIDERANAILVGLADGPLFDAQKAIIDAMYERQGAEFCASGCGVYQSCALQESTVAFVFGDAVDENGNIELYQGFAYFWACCCETNFRDPPLPPRWDPGDLPWNDDPADTDGSGA